MTEHQSQTPSALGPASAAAPVLDAATHRAESARRRRLQVIAALLLVGGLIAGPLTYWLETRNAGPSMEDLIPGSDAENERQMGILYGQTYATIFEWISEAESPAGQGVIIALASALAALVAFRSSRAPLEKDARS